MKIVIAPDSFKESLSAPDVAEAIARGWRRVFPQAEVLLRPLADGGEGTVDAVLAATAGERRECRVEGPLGEPTLAHWGWLDDATAVIEMASASGLHLVPRDRRDATRSSSRGTGELIRAALDAGARKIILGLGGSATNDAGAGLLGALGVRFLAADGEELAPGGAALAGLHSLDLGGLDPRLVDVAVEVAADVDNPLCVLFSQRDSWQVRQLLAPLQRLLDHDPQGSLAATLESWCAHDGHAQACAQALGIHRNSLRYRLERIASISGLDLARLEHRQQLLLGLQLLVPRRG